MPAQVCPGGVLYQQRLWLILQRLPALHKLLKEPLLELFPFANPRSPKLNPNMVPKFLKLPQHRGHSHKVRPSKHNLEPSSVPQKLLQFTPG